MLASRALAITPTITEFKHGLNAGAQPLTVVGGPDGNVWFADDGSPGAIGRITPSSQIAEFTMGLNSPQWIALGPDGNLWFTDFGPPVAVGRINPTTQHVDEFGTANGLLGTAQLNDIVAGPDGNVWFTDYGTPAIGRINPTTLKIDEFGTANGLNAGSNPRIIVPGADGNLWFTDAGTTKAIGRITPSGQITEFTNGLSGGSLPQAIAAGPDGNLWFTDQGSTKAIGRINPTTHEIDEFTAGLKPGASPDYIAAGPDGQLWFTDDGTPNAIGRIDPATQKIEEFGAGLSSTSNLYGIATGPDGNLWFADIGTEEVGRITTPPTATTVNASATGPTTATASGRANGHAQPTSFHVEYGPVGGTTTTTAEHGIGTTSGDTAVAATLADLTPNTTYQARIVVTNPTDTTDGAFRTFTTPPTPALSNLRVSPRRFSLSGRRVKRRCVKPMNKNNTNRHCRRPVHLRVSYTLNVSATVTFTLKRQAPGRKVNGRCVKPTTKNSKHRTCTRLVRVSGKLTVTGTTGTNQFTFNGKLGGHQLGAGTYQLIATPAGGKPTTTTFRIVP
jgi:virginiamycin B lyase